MSHCPKCSQIVAPDAQECSSCGIIFAKVRAHRSPDNAADSSRSSTLPPALDLSSSLAIAALVTGMLAGFTLLFGLAASGGGHGTYVPWYIGLVLFALTWISLLLSVAIEYRRRAAGLPVRWWFGGVLLLLVLATIVGLWGLQG